MRRMLDSISQQEALTFAKKLKEPWKTFAAVTLTDGETIVGHLGGSRLVDGEGREQDYAQFIPRLDTWRFVADGNLVVCHRDLYNEVQFYIPLRDVAGIRQIHISQPIYRQSMRDLLKSASVGGPSPFDEYLSHFSEDERPLRASMREHRRQVLIRASERRERESERESQERSERLQQEMQERSERLESEMQELERQGLSRSLAVNQFYQPTG